MEFGGSGNPILLSLRKQFAKLLIKNSEFRFLMGKIKKTSYTIKILKNEFIYLEGYLNNRKVCRILVKAFERKEFVEVKLIGSFERRVNFSLFALLSAYASGELLKKYWKNRAVNCPSLTKGAS